MQRTDEAAVRQLLKTWKTSNELINHVTAAIKALIALKHNGQLTAQENFYTGLEALKTANQVATILGFGQDQAQLVQSYASLPIHDKHELAINGGDLLKAKLVTPGPMMGQILAACLQAVVMKQVPNQQDALLDFARMVADSKNHWYFLWICYD